MSWFALKLLIELSSIETVISGDSNTMYDQLLIELSSIETNRSNLHK